ncbi:MAG: hypothetical protein HKN72_15435 [Gemmatimonadetes bacterium]|nr:hypothetical protein [Gemmatimonadota bacterium]
MNVPLVVWAVAALTVVSALVPPSVSGQDEPPAVMRIAPEPPQPLDISPGGAFWRALVFPGWGHAAIDSHGRGGFYFAAQTATIYTLLRTRIRLGEAQDRVRFREAILLDRLAAEGVTDFNTIQGRLNGDAPLSDLRNLLDARKEQQEDMVALGIFFLFIGAADAYVSAHLARFPEPLDIGTGVGPTGPTVELALRLPLPR